VLEQALKIRQLTAFAQGPDDVERAAVDTENNQPVHSVWTAFEFAKPCSQVADSRACAYSFSDTLQIKIRTRQIGKRILTTYTLWPPGPSDGALAPFAERGCFT